MILIGTDAGIYRWNEGYGWPVFHSLQYHAVAGLAAAPGGALAVIDGTGKVLESRDNGQSWRTIPRPDGAAATGLALFGSPAALLLATRPLGLYFRDLGAPIPKAPVKPGADLASRVRGLAETGIALLAPKAAPKKVDAKTLKLAGWTALGTPNVPKATVAREIRCLAAPSAEPAAWVATVSGAGVWRSPDLGKGWLQCAGLPSDVYTLRSVPERPGHVWAATRDGAWLSTDGGATWEDRSGGLEGRRTVQAFAVKPGSPDVLLAGAATPEGKSALFESTNGGKAWTQVKRCFPDDLGGDTIADIRFDPAAPDCALVALGSGELWATPNGGFYWGPAARQLHAARVLAAV